MKRPPALADVSGVYLPLLYLLQLVKVLQPVSCIKIQMWKALPISSLNFFLLLLLFRGMGWGGGWGGVVGVVFFPPFPFNFLFLVECIKWSKANFRLTKFKNYFLCSSVCYWKFIPVCTRQEMRIWPCAHTSGFHVEELSLGGPPEYLREKRRKTAGPPLA